jgi:hypothetical protein
MNRSPRGVLSAVVLTALVVFAGCDAMEGPPPIDPLAPVVADLSLAPLEVNADTLAVENGQLRIPLALETAVIAGDAALRRVAYAIEWQFECRPGILAASGEMQALGDGRYRALVDLGVPRGSRGGYRVTAWAVDAAGLPSNEVSAVFDLVGTNIGPPVIEHVEAPAFISPPTTLRFAVTVSDPDGVTNIAGAEVDVAGAGTLPLADTDGAANRNPCDGLYTAAFTVPAGLPPGIITFTFRAFDRDGAVSDPVPFEVRIQ